MLFWDIESMAVLTGRRLDCANMRLALGYGDNIWSTLGPLVHLLAYQRIFAFRQSTLVISSTSVP